MKETKDRILHDAIETAINQRKVISIQRKIIMALVACIGIAIARKAV